MSAALVAATALAAPAQEANELSKPVVALTGVLAKNADTLDLTEAQHLTLKDWLAKMPAQRKALEDETIALRADLRAAILSGAQVGDRQAVADKIGENEAALVMLRSNCTDHWRSVLTPEQFARLITLAGLG
jgi:Spy/CpxP family protein refolding chaperone